MLSSKIQTTKVEISLKSKSIKCQENNEKVRHRPPVTPVNNYAFKTPYTLNQDKLYNLDLN